ncbi:MAG: hypothetical protein ACJ76V_13010 [Thermoleophilaceae bacterium]
MRTRAALLPLFVALAWPTGAFAAMGGTNGGTGPVAPAPVPAPPAALPAPPTAVTLSAGIARTSASVPRAIQLAVRAGNRLQHKPYRYGGGHQSFKDTAYDCSGTVSYVLHAAKLLASPLDSTDLMSWGASGQGAWITIYANPSHAFMVVGGLRLDTSGPGASGPRWRALPRSLDGFTARHPAGL